MKTDLLAVRGLEKTSPAFRAELSALAERLELDPDYIAAVIAVETAGTFSPTIRNPNSTAIGLLQWTKAAAKHVGTSTEELAQMTALEQLEYVERWYTQAPPFDWDFIDDYYLAVFAPARVGSAPADTVYSQQDHTAAYNANKALDRNKDGKITVAEATAPMRYVISEAEKKPRLPIGAGNAPVPRQKHARLIVGAVTVVAALGGALWEHKSYG